MLKAVVRPGPGDRHQLTDLRAGNGAANAALRIEGTRNLVDAAHAAGVADLAQSVGANLPGDEPADEQVSLDVAGPSLGPPRCGSLRSSRCARVPSDRPALRRSLRCGRGTPRTDFARRGASGPPRRNDDVWLRRGWGRSSPRRRRSTGPPRSTCATTTLLRVSIGARLLPTVDAPASVALGGRRGREAPTTLARGAGGHRAMFRRVGFQIEN
jgi:hypothetical protein